MSHLRLITANAFQINGAAGLESWRWLFIIEGLMPIAMSIPVYFLLLTFPEDSEALTERGKCDSQLWWWSLMDI